MKNILVWNCGDDLSYAEHEVTKLLELRTPDWGVVTAGREIEWDDLASFAMGVKPTIFHFIGHGDETGLLEVRQEGSTFGRPASDVIGLVRAASPSLEGVYLSACYSARTGPELLKPLPTAGGWAIGTTSEVEDDLAAVFAQRFYRHLLMDSASPKAAFRMAFAYAGADWTDEVTHSAWFAQSPLPTVSKMAHDINSSIRTIFVRPAFTTRMRDEVSMRELDDALQDVSHALSTGEVRSRQHQSVIQPASFPAEWLLNPEIGIFVTHARSGLTRARRALAELRTGSPKEDRVFGNVLNFDKTVSEDEWMRRVNEVDRARNQILRAANKLFERCDVVHALPEIGQSYSQHDIEQAVTRASMS